MSRDATQWVFSRAQVREVDRRAIEAYGLPGVVLMENAARGLADHVAALAAGRAGRIVIICGGGNNGGDGFAAARHLHNRGLDVAVVVTRPRERYDGDAATNLRIAERMNLDLIDAGDSPTGALESVGPISVIVDALLGTGLDSAVRAPLSEVIAWINRRDEPVIAVDIPSGLDCDTGEPLGDAVRAELTVTFVGVKAGFTQPGAAVYTGRIAVVDIGVPRQLVESLGERRDA